MRIANIIATGTEVTSGQIVNTNASWIAQKLVGFNFEVLKHIAIDDNKDRILESIKLAHQDADLVIMTGGLGPTTDDLTRKIVSDWLDKKLIFDDKEWTRIQSRLKSLDVEPREGHKWQAYFPAGSEIFINNAGTASGFSLPVTTNNKTSLFWFLPGPPSEIQRIWQDHLNLKLTVIGPQKSTKLLSWSFIDLAESELAHVVEPILQHFLETEQFAVGYRASPPIVELKVWVPETLDVKTIPQFLEIEEKLKDHLHYKNHSDPMMLFFKTYFSNNSNTSFYIQDEITEGEIYNRVEQLKMDLSKTIDLKFPKIFYCNTEFRNIKYPYLKLTDSDAESFGFEFFESERVVYKEKIFFKRKVSSLRQKKWICEKLFKALQDKYA